MQRNLCFTLRGFSILFKRLDKQFSSVASAKTRADATRRQNQAPVAQSERKKRKEAKSSGLKQADPYVHLLKYKALAGPNIHPSYNPSVNRLWSFRLS